MKRNNCFRYPKTIRESVNGLRHYNINDKEKLPSVTTILKATEPEEKREALQDGVNQKGEAEATRIVDESAARGTAMHKILEMYILKKVILMKPMLVNKHTIWQYKLFKVV